MKARLTISDALAFRPLELTVWIAVAALLSTAAIAPHLRSLGEPAERVTPWRVKLNSASLDELLTLPGMTSRRAKAILSARDQRGGFESLDELADVPGVTRAYLRRIADFIKVSK